MAQIRILFVCLGNICRSPLGEGILRQMTTTGPMAGRLNVDSAGTGNWHQGEPADHRSIAVGLRHGLDISGLRARKIIATDFHDFDLILAMDRSNLRDLTRLAPADCSAEIHLFMDFAGQGKVDVPDPYQDDDAAFEAVYTMLLNGCEGVVDRLVGDGRSTRGNISSVR